MSLRGFNLGTTRQLLSPREQSDLDDIRSKIACILTDCGFQEAASACRRAGGGAAGSCGCASGPERKNQSISGIEVEGVVREVMKRLRTAEGQANP